MCIGSGVPSISKFIGIATTKTANAPAAAHTPPHSNAVKRRFVTAKARATTTSSRNSPPERDGSPRANQTHRLPMAAGI